MNENIFLVTIKLNKFHVIRVDDLKLIIFKLLLTCNLKWNF